MKVSLFITCLTDTFYPRVGRAMVAVLERLGHTVEFPADQTCCGQPMFNSGYRQDAADLARRMVDVFEGAETIVTPSGSCCAMVHDYYLDLLGDDPAYAERTRRFVENTHEFVDFLLNVERVDLRALGCRYPATATYHYSCHLRGLGMTNEAEVLLSQIEGLQYTELEKKEQCCGFGGTFAVKWPEVSGSLVHDKVRCIKDTKAELVVCNDGGCAMNLQGACHRDGADVRFKHIAELIAEGLGLMEQDPV